jgi:hypothetical protein
MMLPTLFFCPKTIPYTPQWTAPDEEDGHMRVVAPLDIEGVTESGLTLKCTAYKHMVDFNVSFEIAVNGLDGVRRIRLGRVDWKSIRGGHSNKRGHCKGSAWDGKRVPESHYHGFEMNYVVAEERMKKGGKLPCAEPITEPLQTFEEARRFAGIKFNINNIDVVPLPSWVYDLFQ